MRAHDVSSFPHTTILRTRPAEGQPIVVRDFTLPATDAYPLAASLFGRAPMPTDDPLVIVNGATGVPRRFYARFARSLAASGLTVLTYDYRGIGGSRPRSIRASGARMSDWGTRDFEGVLRYAVDGLGKERVRVVGHSVGGQLLGFAESNARVERFVGVASQLGDYRLWPAAARPKLLATWYGVIPLANAIFGYVPGVLGVGEDLPKGVASEWRDWCVTPGYFFGHDDGSLRDGYARLDARALVMSIEADPFAPLATVDAWAAALTNTRVIREHVEERRLGHFGLFREGNADHWSRIASFLL